MEWSESEYAHIQESSTFYYPCPCGDKFHITVDELLDGEGGSLVISQRIIPQSWKGEISIRAGLLIDSPARLTIKLDRLMIVSNQAFSAGFCMYH